MSIHQAQAHQPILAFNFQRNTESTVRRSKSNQDTQAYRLVKKKKSRKSMHIQPEKDNSKRRIRKEDLHMKSFATE